VADRDASGAASAESERERLAELFHTDYASLVRMARLLGEPADAEDVVQTAFVRVFRRGRLRDPHLAAAYLRRTVINETRSRWRRQLTVRRYAWVHPRETVSDADVAVQVTVRRALTTLPRRQREAVVLRYFADLTEAEAADVMGVSVGSVKAYTSRGLAALGAVLSRDEP